MDVNDLVYWSLLGNEWTWNSCKYLFHFSSEHNSTLKPTFITELNDKTNLQVYKLVSLLRHLKHHRGQV